MVRTKDIESDRLTHKETLSGITKKRIHTHTPMGSAHKYRPDTGAGAGDVKTGTHSQHPVAVMGNSKADFSPTQEY